MFLPADFDTAESLWEQAPVDAVEQELLDWTPSDEDQQWFAQQVWEGMMG